MKKIVLVLTCLCETFLGFSQKKSSAAMPIAYYPEAKEWQIKSPESVGLKSDKIQAAIEFAKTHEIKNPRNMEVNHYQTFGKEPYGIGIGPFAERGEPTGVIIHKGYVVATWGEPLRCDMTHSVTKSFLSTVVGLAVDNGLIGSVNDTVYKYVPPIEVYGNPVARPAEDYGKPELLKPFDTPHNRKITWDHLLRQTSDWEGILWGKPEWADRPSANPSEWTTRLRNTPGTVYEYNDVRVNALALAATSVWRKPLPQVLKTMIMDPIGASNTWRWTGYRNSWIVLDGQPVQSVSGGGHWGGGMFINAYDMARFGLLCLRKGRWKDQQLISENWIKQALTPTSAEPTYGYMNWFLNTNQKLLPSAAPNVYYHLGNGTNMVYVDPDHDLVMVVRWIDTKSLDGMVKAVLDAF